LEKTITPENGSSIEKPLVETKGLDKDQKFMSVNKGVVYTVISVEDEKDYLNTTGYTKEKAYIDAAMIFMHEDEKGLLSRLKKTDYPTLRMEVWVTNKNAPVYAISVDGKKNITVAKDDGGAEEKRWLKNITIKLADSKLYKGLTHPEYPENSLRYLIVKGKRVEMWEVSLISQRGEFFVVEHQSYNVELFRNRDGKVVVPEFSERRPQFEKFILGLPEVQALDPAKLRTIPKYLVEKLAEKKRLEKRRFGLEKRHGIVAWFTPGQKIGMIYTATEEVRVHYSQIVGPENKLKMLKSGDLVEFRELRNIVHISGPTKKTTGRTLAMQTTRRQTGFKKEAIQVQVIK